MQQKLYSRDQLIKSIDDLAGELERKDQSDKVICDLLKVIARYELNQNVLEEFDEAYWAIISEFEKLRAINDDEDTGWKALGDKVDVAAEQYNDWKGYTSYGNGANTPIEKLCLNNRDRNKAMQASIPTKYTVAPYLPEAISQPENDTENQHDENIIYTDDDFNRYKEILVEALNKSDHEKTELIADLDSRLNAYRHAYEEAQTRRGTLPQHWEALSAQRDLYQERELRRIQLDNINHAVRKMKSVQPGGAG